MQRFRFLRQSKHITLNTNEVNKNGNQLLVTDY
jgi:hypothetical protein